MRKKPNRLGTRESSDHNSFFERIHSISTSHDVSHSSEGNGTATCGQNTTQNANDMMRQMINKMDGIEDFMIKILVKLDNLCSNPIRKSNQISTEIDISALLTLDLPAECEADMQKLEENLKSDDFKQKLVRISIDLDPDIKL